MRDMDRLFAPRGVAFVGVSEDLRKYGGRCFRYCLDGGYGGGVYPVNPKYRQVFGRPCAPDLRAVEGPVDVVVALVGPAQLPALHDAAHEIGAAFLIAIGALADKMAPDAAARLARLVDAARRRGPRIVGPDCVGIVAPHARLAMSISSVLPAGLPRAGRVALISQSGGMLGAAMDRARRSGAGFSALISCGGEADLTICDYVEHLIRDAATAAIAIYAEGIDDWLRFFALAGRAREADKPILLLKAGRSAAGQQAALSHSGRLAGDRELLEAACRRHGVILAGDLDDLHVTGEALVRFRVAPGSGVGAVSTSGGYAVTVGDALSLAGLPVPELAPPIVERIRREVAQPRPANPVDAAARGAPGQEAADVRRALAALADDPGIGATVYAETTLLDMDSLVPELLEHTRSAAKPHLTCWQSGPTVDGVLARLRAGGGFAVDDLRQAVAALKALYDHAALAAAPPVEAPPVLFGAARTRNLPPGSLDEHQARALLADYGVALVETLDVSADGDPAAAAEQLGFPVALKGMLPGVHHKTEHDLVRLGLADAMAVRAAARELGARVPGPAGFTLQPMVRGVEFIVGVKSEAATGPAVLLGFGGILAEAMARRAVELAPIDLRVADAMIDAVDAKGVLAGYRTGRKLARSALRDMLVAVGRLAWEQQARLAELDLNPVVVDAERAVAVDVLVVLRRSDRLD